MKGIKWREWWLINSVQIIGNITKDIELKETGSGVKYTRFSVAVNRGTKKEDGTYETDFFNVVAWRKTAELVKNYFGKGKKIAIVGKLQNYEYQGQDGIKRGTEIVANEVHIIEKKEVKEEKEEVKEDPMSDEVFSEFGDSIEITDDEVAF